PRHEESRKRYEPDDIRVLFVAESPPAAEGRFFFFEDVATKDSLFLEMVKCIYRLPRFDRDRKREFLERFKRDGFHLIDAVTTPLSERANKKRAIRDSIELLKRRLRALCNSETKIVLICKSVYDVCFQELVDEGFSVINTRAIPYPGQGHAIEFRE